MEDRVPPGNGVGSVIRTSVATLYSNLVTRPTGRAVRYAIERQLRDAKGICLSVLDFSQVGIVDFSCADEVVAKLLLGDRASVDGSRAFFLACGVSDHHREPIEAALRRHGLLLVTLGPDGERSLWGPAPSRLRRAWRDVEDMGRVEPDEYATRRGLGRPTARAWLARLVARRVAALDGGAVCSLCGLLRMASPAAARPGGVRPPAQGFEADGDGENRR